MNARSLQGQEREMPAICFPLPATRGDQTTGRARRLARLGDLLPQHWRRRVVIGGMSFWRPG